MVNPQNPKNVLVTAALPYSNGPLHVGHIAGAYLPADIYVRHLRLAGLSVHSICGSDDHGVAIAMAAAKEGQSPAALAQHYNARHQKALKGLGINFDIYGATSRNPYHARTSQDLFLKLHAEGCFAKQETEQFYDPQAKVFLPDRFVKGECGYCGAADQNGDQCEECGKMLDVSTLKHPYSAMSREPAVIRKTVHWFLDLSRFQSQVEKWLERARLREHTRTYVRGLLAAGLVKRSMTRDLDWGIPVPLDDPQAAGKVLYVWFDAPIGYISNTKELCQTLDGDAEKYAEWWKSPQTEIYHFIGEDNTIFHTVMWVAMLSAEGSFQLPRGVIVNHFLNIKFAGKEEEKISKSRGSAIWIEDYLAEGGNPDVLRYYLTAVAPEQARTVYRPDDLVSRNNGELGNILGNLVHRVLTFTRKYCGPQAPDYDKTRLGARDQELKAALQQAHGEILALLDDFSFRAALERIMQCGRACNKYLDDKAPWLTRKSDMAATRVTLACSLDAIKFLAVCLLPFMPFSAQKIAAMLSLDPSGWSWDSALEELPSGTPLAEPEILFPRLE